MKQVIMGIRVEIINKRNTSIMIEWAAQKSRIEDQWSLRDSLPGMHSCTAGCFISAAGDRVWVEAMRADVLEPACTAIWASAGIFVVQDAVGWGRSFRQGRIHEAWKLPSGCLLVQGS